MIMAERPTYLALMVATLLLLLAPVNAQEEETAHAACTSIDDYNERMEAVRENCCSGFGQENNCRSGVPDVCDETCALTYTVFWADCKTFINTDVDVKSVRMMFEGVNGLCQATLSDNKVHVTPGNQFDPNAPLSGSVSCHQTKLKTAGELSANTGPMDGLWMLGVVGDTKCLYSKEARADPQIQAQCPVMKNKQLLFDTMEKRFGDCTLNCKGEGCTRGPDSGWVEPHAGDRRRLALNKDEGDGVPNYEICDYSLDTNGDGKVGEGDDLWHGAMFGAILSKDGLYFMVTNNVTRNLVKYAECDEVVGG